MNNGKKLEKLVRLVQEALKNIPNTEIFSNYKIENISGRNREIDVFIKSQINGMDITIAIECKDYKNAIPVKEIEAFNSKCCRIKGISKKIYVSSNGYQADAIEAAKDFEIELYKLNEISKQQIKEWFPIKKLNPNIKLKQPYKIYIHGTEDDMKNIPNEEIILHFDEDRPSTLITSFLWNEVVVPEQRTILNYMLFGFMKGNCRKEDDKYTRMPFVLDVKGVYIFGKNNKKINVHIIEAEVVCWYGESPAHIIEAKNYEKIGANPDATVVSLDVGKKETAELVMTQNNDFSIFHTKNDGQTYKMDTLAIYDPKKDELKIIKKDKNES